MSRRPPIPNRRPQANRSAAKDSQEIAKLLQEGLTLHRAGNINDAKLIYEKILKKDGNNLDAMQLLATVNNQQKNYHIALNYFDKALQISKTNAVVFNNRGNALKELKRFDDALQSYAEALRLKPDYVEAFCNRGATLQELKRFDDALQSYTEALRIKPDYAEAFYNRGVTLQKLKRFDDALQSYDQVLRIKPNYAAAFINRGIALKELKRFDDALQSYDQALRIKPNYAEAFCNRGATLQELKRFEDALQSYDQALRIKPDYAEVFYNRGIALKELTRLHDALQSYAEALRINPNYAKAFYNRGVILQELKQFDDALQSYDQALRIKPNIEFLLGTRQFTRMHLCQWSDFSKDVNHLRTSVESNLPSSLPFAFLGLIDDPQIQKSCASTYINYKYPAEGKNYIKDLRVRGVNPKIGYFSADFHNHATLHLMLEVFKYHDHSRFDFYAFSFGPQTNDPWQQEVKKYFKEFIDIKDKSDTQVAELSRKLGIDIAIDLKGFTQDARTGIFANRAAPIQINYLGYPGTMGANYIDYIIADRVLIPEGSQKFYSEKVLYLPNCYQPNIHTREISKKIIQRKDVGLPENVAIYCSFNNIYKLTPEMFSVWLDILSQVENSVLWILSISNTAKNNLIKYTKEQGIDSSRIIFAPYLPIEEHLKRLPLADVFLDTFPYNAHTTASDSVRMGIPIVTLAGQSFASRVAASILTAVDMTDLITNNIDDYKHLAIRLGTDGEYLQKTKDRLSQSIPKSSLFDSVRFTRDLEAIYSSFNDSQINRILNP